MVNHIKNHFWKWMKLEGREWWLCERKEVWMVLFTHIFIFSLQKKKGKKKQERKAF